MDNREKPPQISIDGVEIQEEIASTHSGNISIQRVLINKNEYIMKSVKCSSIETELQLTHLYNERQALWELNHKLLNKLVGTSKDQKHLYFFLEFVEGLTLDKLLQMEVRLKPRFVKLIIYQISVALNYMHQQGFVYRDLKANNLIINKQGQMTIIDFGFSKKIGKERTFTFCGTTHAMAPEFFSDQLDEQGYSFGVDHYSLGILIFELLTGQPPFGYYGDKQKELIQEGIQDIMLKKINDQVTSDLIQKLLQIKKNEQLRLGYQGGFDEILKHPYFDDIKQAGQQIIEGQNTEILFDQVEFHEQYIDDIETFGIHRKAVQVSSIIKNSKQIDLLEELFS